MTSAPDTITIIIRIRITLIVHLIYFCTQSQQHLHVYIAEEWEQMETELTRERGLWGPPCSSILDKWLQDVTEGPSRMRKKMIRNDHFYVNYPYRADYETLENVS